MEIYPSLISSDLLNLEKVVKSLQPYSDGFHIDVMDDHFVPNLTWGPSFVHAILKISEKSLCIHLMVDNPWIWIDRLKLRTIDSFVFHFEAASNNTQIHDLIDDVKAKGFKVGIAINPETSVEKIFEFLEKINQVVIMSVKPGFSGQTFIDNTLEKIEPLLSFRKEKKMSYILSMDGGINQENLRIVKEKGIDRVSVASAIFSNDNPIEALRKLKEF
ncbi:ribulose-phosphate 3-epimerase [Candidatus Babeliales bacterium]|nr:ribulose-phosphate 3-epimerase [Candidatus Babeliales bacterium]